FSQQRHFKESTVEIAAITGALSGIKAASEIAKIIKDSGTSLEAAEIKFKLAELIDALADAKIEVADFKELISLKDDQINELRKELRVQQKVVWEEPYYFALEGEVKDGPYCQRCYDVESNLVRLQSPNKNGYWNCTQCENSYSDSSYKKPPPVKVW
ncbi:hypothetical protein AB4379_09015, partial [Vibrio breoganii]